jgi:alkylhydroperoxidase family enzyme
VPWIEQVPVEDADGLLKEQFDEAMKRAGRVWRIVHVMSLNPQALRDNIRLYLTLMMGASPLSRTQRELLATVVSAELECHY